MEVNPAKANEVG